MNLKKLIPINIKIFIYNKYENYKLNKKYKRLKNKRKIFIFGSPNHGNLGDHAITNSQIEFIKNNFKEYKIIEVTLFEYKKNIAFIKKYINKSDIITINGGGNFGNQYIFDENIRRDVIKNFPNNKILLFPQTIYFTSDKDGKLELEKSKNIYSNHKNLILVAREKTSFKLMKENFKNNTILLTPDIVLYLDKYKKEVNRKGALFCMRSDLESKFSEEEKKELLEILKYNYNYVKITDTVINKNITKEERENILNIKFDEFRKCELIITDRIHGMVFAAITSTPCIALSNYNQKVIGTYEWIKHLNYIKFANNMDEVKEYINELKEIKEYRYNNSYAINYYNQIIKSIKEK